MNRKSIAIVLVLLLLQVALATHIDETEHEEIVSEEQTFATTPSPENLAAIANPTQEQFNLLNPAQKIDYLNLPGKYNNDFAASVFVRNYQEAIKNEDLAERFFSGNGKQGQSRDNIVRASAAAADYFKEKSGKTFDFRNLASDFVYENDVFVNNGKQLPLDALKSENILGLRVIADGFVLIEKNGEREITVEGDGTGELGFEDGVLSFKGSNGELQKIETVGDKPIKFDFDSSGSITIDGAASGSVFVNNQWVSFNNNEGRLFLGALGDITASNALVITSQLYADGRFEFDVGTQEVSAWAHADSRNSGQTTIFHRPSGIRIDTGGQSKVLHDKAVSRGEIGEVAKLHLDATVDWSKYAPADKSAKSTKPASAALKEISRNLPPPQPSNGKNFDVFVKELPGGLVVSAKGSGTVQQYDDGIPPTRKVGGFKFVGRNGISELDSRLTPASQEIDLRGQVEFEDAHQKISTKQDGVSLGSLRKVGDKVNNVEVTCHNCKKGRAVSINRGVVSGDLSQGSVTRSQIQSLAIDVDFGESGLEIGTKIASAGKLADEIANKGVITGESFTLVAHPEGNPVSSNKKKQEFSLIQEGGSIIGRIEQYDEAGEIVSKPILNFKTKGEIGDEVIIVTDSNKKEVTQLLSIVDTDDPQKFQQLRDLQFDSNDPNFAAIQKLIRRTKGVDISQLNDQNYIAKKTIFEAQRLQLLERGIEIDPVTGTIIQGQEKLADSQKNGGGIAYFYSAARINFLQAENIEDPSKVVENEKAIKSFKAARTVYDKLNSPALTRSIEAQEGGTSEPAESFGRGAIGLNKRTVQQIRNGIPQDGLDTTGDLETAKLIGVGLEVQRSERTRTQSRVESLQRGIAATENCVGSVREGTCPTPGEKVNLVRRLQRSITEESRKLDEIQSNIERGESELFILAATQTRPDSAAIIGEVSGDTGIIRNYANEVELIDPGRADLLRIDAHLIDARKARLEGRRADAGAHLGQIVAAGAQAQESSQFSFDAEVQEEIEFNTGEALDIANTPDRYRPEILQEIDRKVGKGFIAELEQVNNIDTKLAASDGADFASRYEGFLGGLQLGSEQYLFRPSEYLISGTVSHFTGLDGPGSTIVGEDGDAALPTYLDAKARLEEKAIEETQKRALQSGVLLGYFRKRVGQGVSNLQIISELREQATEIKLAEDLIEQRDLLTNRNLPQAIKNGDDARIRDIRKRIADRQREISKLGEKDENRQNAIREAVNNPLFKAIALNVERGNDPTAIREAEAFRALDNVNRERSRNQGKDGRIREIIEKNAKEFEGTAAGSQLARFSDGFETRFGILPETGIKVIDDFTNPTIEQTDSVAREILTEVGTDVSNLIPGVAFAKAGSLAAKGLRGATAGVRVAGGVSKGIAKTIANTEKVSRAINTVKSVNKLIPKSAKNLAREIVETGRVAIVEGRDIARTTSELAQNAVAGTQRFFGSTSRALADEVAEAQSVLNGLEKGVIEIEKAKEVVGALRRADTGLGLTDDALKSAEQALITAREAVPEITGAQQRLQKAQQAEQVFQRAKAARKGLLTGELTDIVGEGRQVTKESKRFVDAVEEAVVRARVKGELFTETLEREGLLEEAVRLTGRINDFENTATTMRIKNLFGKTVQASQSSAVSRAQTTFRALESTRAGFTFTENGDLALDISKVPVEQQVEARRLFTEIEETLGSVGKDPQEFFQTVARDEVARAIRKVQADQAAEIPGELASQARLGEADGLPVVVESAGEKLSLGSRISELPESKQNALINIIETTPDVEVFSAAIKNQKARELLSQRERLIGLARFDDVKRVDFEILKLELGDVAGRSVDDLRDALGLEGRQLDGLLDEFVGYSGDINRHVDYERLRAPASLEDSVTEAVTGLSGKKLPEKTIEPLHVEDPFDLPIPETVPDTAGSRVIRRTVPDDVRQPLAEVVDIDDARKVRAVTEEAPLKAVGEDIMPIVNPEAVNPAVVDTSKLKIVDSTPPSTIDGLVPRSVSTERLDEINKISEQARKIRLGESTEIPLLRKVNLDTSSREAYGNSIARYYESQLGFPEGTVSARLPETAPLSGNEVLLLTVKEGGIERRTLAVKLYLTEDSRTGIKALDAFKEIEATNLLRRQGASVPDVVDVIRVDHPDKNGIVLVATEIAQGTDVRGKVKSLGRLPVGSRERARLLENLVNDFGNVGDEVGRLHNSLEKSSTYPTGGRAATRIKGELEALVESGELQANIAQRAIGRLESEVAKFDAAGIKPSLNHGDLHGGNIFIDDTGKVTFIDLETSLNSLTREGLARGVPASDYGRFINDLRVRGELAGLSPDEITDLKQAFLSKYIQSSGVSVEEIRAADYIYSLRVESVWASSSPDKLERAAALKRLKKTIEEGKGLDLDFLDDIVEPALKPGVDDVLRSQTPSEKAIRSFSTNFDDPEIRVLLQNRKAALEADNLQSVRQIDLAILEQEVRVVNNEIVPGSVDEIRKVLDLSDNEFREFGAVIDDLVSGTTDFGRVNTPLAVRQARAADDLRSALKNINYPQDEIDGFIRQLQRQNANFEGVAADVIAAGKIKDNRLFEVNEIIKTGRNLEAEGIAKARAAVDALAPPKEVRDVALDVVDEIDELEKLGVRVSRRRSTFEFNVDGLSPEQVTRANERIATIRDKIVRSDSANNLLDEVERITLRRKAESVDVPVVKEGPVGGSSLREEVSIEARQQDLEARVIEGRTVEGRVSGASKPEAVQPKSRLVQRDVRIGEDTIDLESITDKEFVRQLRESGIIDEDARILQIERFSSEGPTASKGLTYGHLDDLRNRHLADPKAEKLLIEEIGLYQTIKIKGKDGKNYFLKIGFDDEVVSPTTTISDALRRHKASESLQQRLGVRLKDGTPYELADIIPETTRVRTKDGITLSISPEVPEYRGLGKIDADLELDNFIAEQRRINPGEAEILLSAVEKERLLDEIRFQLVYNVYTSSTDVELGVAKIKGQWRITRIDDELTFSGFSLPSRRYTSPYLFGANDITSNDLIRAGVDVGKYKKGGVFNEELFRADFGHHIETLQLDNQDIIRAALREAKYTEDEIPVILAELRSRNGASANSVGSSLEAKVRTIVESEDGRGVLTPDGRILHTDQVAGEQEFRRVLINSRAADRRTALEATGVIDEVAQGRIADEAVTEAAEVIEDLLNRKVDLEDIVAQSRTKNGRIDRTEFEALIDDAIAPVDEVVLQGTFLSDELVGSFDDSLESIQRGFKPGDVVILDGQLHYVTQERGALLKWPPLKKRTFLNTADGEKKLLVSRLDEAVSFQGTTLPNGATEVESLEDLVQGTRRGAARTQKKVNLDSPQEGLRSLARGDEVDVIPVDEVGVRTGPGGIELDLCAAAGKGGALVGFAGFNCGRDINLVELQEDLSRARAKHRRITERLSDRARFVQEKGSDPFIDDLVQQLQTQLEIANREMKSIENDLFRFRPEIVAERSTAAVQYQNNLGILDSELAALGEEITKHNAQDIERALRAVGIEASEAARIAAGKNIDLILQERISPQAILRIVEDQQSTRKVLEGISVGEAAKIELASLQKARVSKSVDVLQLEEEVIKGIKEAGSFQQAKLRPSFVRLERELKIIREENRKIGKELIRRNFQTQVNGIDSALPDLNNLKGLIERSPAGSARKERLVANLEARELSINNQISDLNEVIQKDFPDIRLTQDDFALDAARCAAAGKGGALVGQAAALIVCDIPVKPVVPAPNKVDPRFGVAANVDGTVDINFIDGSTARGRFVEEADGVILIQEGKSQFRRVSSEGLSEAQRKVIEGSQASSADIAAIPSRRVRNSKTGAEFLSEGPEELVLTPDNIKKASLDLGLVEGQKALQFHVDSAGKVRLLDAGDTTLQGFKEGDLVVPLVINAEGKITGGYVPQMFINGKLSKEVVSQGLIEKLINSKTVGYNRKFFPKGKKVEVAAGVNKLPSFRKVEILPDGKVKLTTADSETVGKVAGEVGETIRVQETGNSAFQITPDEFAQALRTKELTENPSLFNLRQGYLRQEKTPDLEELVRTFDEGDVLVVDGKLQYVTEESTGLFGLGGKEKFLNSVDTATGNLNKKVLVATKEEKLARESSKTLGQKVKDLWPFGLNQQRKVEIPGVKFSTVDISIPGVPNKYATIKEGDVSIELFKKTVINPGNYDGNLKLGDSYLQLHVDVTKEVVGKPQAARDLIKAFKKLQEVDLPFAIVGDTPNPSLLKQAKKLGGVTVDAPLRQKFLVGTTYKLESKLGIVPTANGPVQRIVILTKVENVESLEDLVSNTGRQASRTAERIDVKKAKVELERLAQGKGGEVLDLDSAKGVPDGGVCACARGGALAGRAIGGVCACLATQSVVAA